MLTKIIKYFGSQCSPFQIISHPDLPIIDCNFINSRNPLLSQYGTKILEDTSRDLHDRQDLISSVNAFKIQVYSNIRLKINFQEALNNIEKGHPLYKCKAQQVFQMLSHLCLSPPRFHKDTKTEIPFFNLFLSLLGTRFGQHFFSSEVVHQHFQTIIRDYQILLNSNKSLDDLDEILEFSFEKQRNWEFGQNQEIKLGKPRYLNWIQWYSRPLQQQLSFDKQEGVVYHGTKTYPFNFEIFNEQNPKTQSARQDIQGLQRTMLSLNELFQTNHTHVNYIIQNHFNGGMYYQSYFTPLGYHRWHSPVSGKIVYTFKINSQYYLDKPNLGLLNKGLHKNNLQDMMIKKSGNKHIVIIELSQQPKRYVAVVAIGSSVSSCVSRVIEGETVQQGEQLGYFEFGSYSTALIFDKNLKLKFNPEIYFQSTQIQSITINQKQQPNTVLATYT